MTILETIEAFYVVRNVYKVTRLSNFVEDITMAQKAHSSVVIFHSSVVILFENIRASKSRKGGSFQA